MKLLDDVIVTTDNYANEGVYKGMRGTILDAPIIWNSFFVNFQDQRVYDKEFMHVQKNIFNLNDDIYIPINIKDLEVIKHSKLTDAELAEALPPAPENWWCKVENGYILNAKGERKNKIAYDYDS